jgi:uncharacterized protein YbaR (Trm112 family)
MRLCYPSAFARIVPLPRFSVLLLGACALATKPLRLLQFSFHPGGVFMTVPEELLAILVCPICKTPVRPLPDDSGLKCSSCKRIYPVRDDIPVMLPEESSLASE